jgi:elongation factor Tu
MPWWRRRDADNAESLDPQYLLAQAHTRDATPEPWGGFRLTVQDVFTIKGRGTAVTGQVESGSIHVGATVRQTRPNGRSRELTVAGIEMFRKVTDNANAGDNVGLLFRELTRGDIRTGDVLTA